MKDNTPHRSVSPVEQPFTQNCPYCNAPAQEVGKGYIKRLGNQYLIKTEHPYPSALYHNGLSRFEEVHCNACSKIFFFIGFKTLQPKTDDVIGSKNSMEDDYKNISIFKNYVIIENKQKWIMSRMETDEGILLDNIFGPYPKIGSIFKNDNTGFRSQFDFKPEYNLLMIAGESLFLDPAQPGKQK